MNDTTKAIYLLPGEDGSAKGAGFYMEQFAGMPGASLSDLGLLANSMAAGNQDVIAAGLVGGAAGQAQQGMYESVMNYALKPEKGMPPTPPGKHREGLDGGSQVANC